jgi:hypothetical protein
VFFSHLRRNGGSRGLERDRRKGKKKSTYTRAKPNQEEMREGTERRQRKSSAENNSRDSRTEKNQASNPLQLAKNLIVSRAVVVLLP